MTAIMNEPKLLQQTSHFLAVYKPHHYHSVPALAHPTHKNIVDWACSQNLISLPESSSSSSPQMKEGGLLNRLDFGTSGLLVFALNVEMYEKAREAWTNPDTIKLYTAISESSDKSTQPVNSNFPITLNTPIGHHSTSKKRMLAQKSPTDRRTNRWLAAETRVTSIEPHHNDYRKIEVRILTGVRHQIRVHLAGINLPIVGDPLYSQKYKENYHSLVPEIRDQRLLLHCHTIKFLNEQFECPHPPDFKILSAEA